MEQNLSPENQIVTPAPIQPAKSNSKLLPMLLVILLILIVAAGAFVLGKYPAENKSEPPTVIPTAIPTALPTADPTENWKTLQFNVQMLDPKQSAKKVSIQIPNGWGIIISMELGTFIQITKDENFNSGGIIQIKEDKDSSDVLQINIDQSNGTYSFNKKGNNPIFDQILSTFKFLD